MPSTKHTTHTYTTDYSQDTERNVYNKFYDPSLTRRYYYETINVEHYCPVVKLSHVNTHAHTCLLEDAKAALFAKLYVTNCAYTQGFMVTIRKLAMGRERGRVLTLPLNCFS